MERTVLIAGKEYPAGSALASAAINHNRKVVITSPFGAPENEDTIPTEEISTVAWNKSSSVSARSIVLQAENVFQKVDEAVLVFDTACLSPNFNSMTPEICSRAIDTMITSYFYLSLELVNRFIKQGGGSIIFMLKSAPGLVDMTSSTTIHGENSSVPVGILPFSAQAAFKALAESTAAKYTEKEELKFFLVNAEYDIPDNQFAGWMFEYLDSAYISKTKQDIRHVCQWIKIGSKPQTSFPFFRK